MTQKTYGFFILFSAFLNAILLGSIIFSTDPEKAHFFIFFLLYLSIFMVLFGIIYGISYYAYQKIFGLGSVFKSVQTASRQSFLVSLFLVGILMLQAIRVLNWYNFTLFVLIVSVVEYFFVSRKISYGK